MTRRRADASVKMACEDVIQMKNRKITVPCASSRGSQRAVRQQENQQRDQQRRDESGHPRQARVALLVRLLLRIGGNAAPAEPCR